MKRNKFADLEKIKIEILKKKAKQTQELTDEIYQYLGDIESLEQENKRYREVVRGVQDILESEDWSKYEAIALQDNIHDFITIKNNNLLEGK